MANDITDPAWFYSSLAQVSASMVGIIGAVFATRIADYTERVRKSFDDIQRTILSHHNNLKAAAKTMTDEQTLIANHAEQHDRPMLAEAATLYRTIAGRVTPKDVQRLIAGVNDIRPRLQGPWPINLLDTQGAWLADIDHQLCEFRTMAWPRSLWAVWVLLVWLTFVGIIRPMVALPGIGGTVLFSKEVILLLFSAGALVFVAFLGYELMRLWRLALRFEWR